MKKAQQNLERINDSLFTDLTVQEMELVFGGVESQLSFEQCGSDKIDVTIDPD